MASEEMLIVKKAYDFSRWIFQHTGKFPKSYRFSVAVRIEQTVLEFTEIVAVANMRSNRIVLLREADEHLMRLRLLIRLSYDMQFLNLKSYEFGSRSLAELGRMLGGWIKKSG
jgi:hypothetical protein